MFKKYIFTIFTLSLFLTTNAQDYHYVFKYLKKQNDAQSIARFKEITEQENKQYLVINFKLNMLKIDSIKAAKTKILEEINESFDDNNSDPLNSAHCIEYEKLSGEVQMLEKRMNQVDLLAKLAKTSYTLCTKSDCSYEYNTYNNHVRELNNIISNLKSTQTKATYYYEKCNALTSEYNQGIDDLNSSTSNKEDEINDEIDALYKKNEETLNNIKAYLYNKEFPIKLYHANGKLQAVGKYYYGANEKSGEWQFYTTNGILNEVGSFKDNKRQGVWTIYYENNNKSLTTTFNLGMANGESVSYYESGKLEGKGNYKNDKKEGFWKYYYENGKVNKMGNYKNGEYTGTWKYYDENGKPIQTKNY